MKNTELLDTNLLNVFVIIAESNSLTDAAKRIGITQSAVSQCLKQLEEHFNTELVMRRTKPVKLTVAGDVLKKDADAILGELRRLNATVREAAKTGQVKCRLGLITSFSESFGSNLFANLSRETEMLVLKSGLTSTLTEAFLNRDIDILVSDVSFKEQDNLQCYKLLRDPMLLAIPEKYYQPGNGSIEAIAQQLPLIKYSRASNIGSYSELVLRRLQAQTNVRYETDDTHTLMNFVKDGHGWAILSSICLAQVLYKIDGVKIVELDRSRHYRDIYLISRKNELGVLPEKVVTSIKDIFSTDIYPQIAKAVDWIKPELFKP